MAIGLKRGTVVLADHDPEWEIIAAQIIEQLWCVFGSVAKDIQHVGSTAIKGIKAKPMIDIAVGVVSFDDLTDTFSRLEEMGVYKSTQQPIPGDILCAVKDSRESETCLCVIHIVIIDSIQWQHHINFRDYLNNFPQKAAAYETVKVESAKNNSDDRNAYLESKKAFIEECHFEAAVYTDLMKDIEITSIEPIKKGWSGDKKYYIETADGKQLFLRVSDISEIDRKKAEYNMMERVYELGVLTSQPLGFGLCRDGTCCYSLSGWLDGEDAEAVLPLLPETEQYVLGMKAGETLRKIHILPAPENIEPWKNWFYSKVRARIDFCNENLIQSKKIDIIVRYLQDNKHLLDGRPQTFCHGDFNLSNMMIMPGRQIGVIDFNYFNKDHGDPWWEFDPCMDGWGSEPVKHFHTGLINGYFNGDPPSEFFDVLSYYLAYDALAALCDTSVHNQGEPEVGRRHMENILSWFDDMKNSVPSWYLKDFYIQWTDSIPYKLKSPFDFSFLNKYGKVFKVYDDQDSGNICFGIADGDKRYFVKFAGAPTERACVSAEDAIINLKRTVPIYQDLAHPNLVRLVGAEAIGSGFAMIFEWADAECMHQMYPLSRRTFMQMTLETRHQVFEEILEFHAHVVRQGYIAIDFYDGSIMYDFGRKKTIICDIDFYTKAPYINNMGRLWGSSRFMSPEEYQLGATIDEITNVYVMGAAAFALFGDERDRCIEKWQSNQKLFDVAKRAVSDERDNRQQSIEQLMEEWRAAK